MSACEPRAFQVVDLTFGDAGKGTMVDHLVRQREADLVVRFNGGPQAGHNVVLADGRHHTFAQFGSGSFVPGVRSLLSRYMLIEPWAMLNEAAHLQSLQVDDVLARTIIDERCRVITPPQQMINRMRERARGDGAHGTCGMGVGECVADFLASPDHCLTADDLRDRSRLTRKLRENLEFKRAAAEPLRAWAEPAEWRVFEDASWIDIALDVYREVAARASIAAPQVTRRLLANSRCAVFEGAQGVLLDENYGFHPHTTWSSTTFQNADVLLDECGSPARRCRIGVLRTYLTRHGPGPFISERSDLADSLPEIHNGNTGFQGRFRRGVLDLVMLRYALAACGRVDALAVTHLDCLPRLPSEICTSYLANDAVVRTLPQNFPATVEQGAALTQWISDAIPLFESWPMHDVQTFVGHLEDALCLSVQYGSSGPSSDAKAQLCGDQ